MPGNFGQPPQTPGNFGPASVSAPAPAPAPAPASAPAPAAAPEPKVATIADLTPEDKVIITNLQSLQAQLSGAGLSGIALRKLGELDAGINALLQKLAHKALLDHTKSDLSQMSAALANYDFDSAKRFHKSLTQSSWSEHKDWIKPLSSVIDLGKRFLRR